jgi:hypothetical protein
MPWIRGDVIAGLTSRHSGGSGYYTAATECHPTSCARKGKPVTEAEWLRCGDPDPMLSHVCGVVPDRKLRLFLVACSRRNWDWICEPVCRRAIEVSEAFADGLTDEPLLDSAHADAERFCMDVVYWDSNHEQFSPHVGAALWAAAETALSPDSLRRRLHQNSEFIPETSMASRTASEAANARALFAESTTGNKADRTASLTAERAVQTGLLRDIFGNPVRPVSFSPEWRTDTAVSLARQMYESREFSAMPILADALQDAGCDNDGVLSHCRDGTLTHVRGCWVVDLVLNKS